MPAGDRAGHKKLAAIDFFLAAALVGLALVFLYIAWLDDGPPPRSHLSEATGIVESLWDRKGTVGFRLPGEPLRFEVPSNLGEFGSVRWVGERLARSPHEPITIRYDASDRRHPWFSHGDDFYMVFEISRGEQKLLDYGAGAANWHADNRIGWWVCPLVILAALWFLRSGFGQLRLGRECQRG